MTHLLQNLKRHNNRLPYTKDQVKINKPGRNSVHDSMAYIEGQSLRERIEAQAAAVLDHPKWDPLRSDPRFHALIDKMNFPDRK
jgi:hypothetical protein